MLSALHRWIVVATLASAAACPAFADQEIPGYPPIDEYDPREMAMLPKFCPYTTMFNEKVPGGNNLDERERWKDVIGPMFQHIHHFCFGIMKTNRGSLLARTEQARRFYLSNAIQEFDYVISRAPSDFVLLPEILARKGQNQIMLGMGPKAVLTLERSMELKPDYWPPYAYLSDYFLQVGEVGKAREYLERGIQAGPKNGPLTRRLEDLDRKQPARSTAGRSNP